MIRHANTEMVRGTADQASARDRILAAFDGRPGYPRPVAPAYPNGLLGERVRRRYLEHYLGQMREQEHVVLDHAADVEVWVAAWRDAYRTIPDRPDWTTITVGAPRSTIDGARLVRREDGWYRVDPGGGRATHLWENVYSQDSWETEALSSTGQVEACVPVMSAESLLADGRFDLPRRIIAELGQAHFTMTYLSPPFAATYDIVGFSGMMTMPLERPDLTEALLQQLYRRDIEWARACAVAGFDGILLENCLVSADLISPRLFETVVYPWDCRFVRALNDLGLRVVHYFCGDVTPRLPLLREMDVDCLAVEESKKGFEITVGEVVAAVGDRMCVAGNVDATQVPGWSEEELDADVSRQVQQAEGALGFVISTGSPFPADAPLDTLIKFMSAGRRHASDRRSGT